ncbi:MAG: hypothetical protein QOJ63_740 [Solirubrobacteraceae bacterium]|jgi:hypothetical protein|nr:hypothetical protein [Solirubrobacteraceae bacterium]
MSDDDREPTASAAREGELVGAGSASSGAGPPAAWAVRLATAAVAFGALWFAVTADTPARLPSVALKQELVYRGELLLAVLYGGLLIATPVLRGILSGLLPTEITARGAKYDPEPVSAGLKAAEERIDQLNEVIETSSGHLARLGVDLAGLRKRVERVEEGS